MSVTVVTHLNLRGDARAALEFYRSVFGGELTIVTYRDALDQTTTWTYDALGRKRGTTYPDATQETVAYDATGNPTLLLADEPTTALDATVQIQVLLLIRELQREFNLGVIFVTHDIGVAVEVSDRIGVMYAGKLVEMAPVERMVDAPQHPYSRGLLASTVHDGMRGQRLDSIPGAPPDLAEVPSGCSFAPRCKFVRPDCTSAVPSLRDVEAAHAVRCVLAA